MEQELRRQDKHRAQKEHSSGLYQKTVALSVPAGVAGPAGDTAGFTIAEGAIEIVAGVALAGVEHEQRLARRARLFFEGHHQGAGDALPPP